MSRSLVLSFVLLLVVTLGGSPAFAPSSQEVVVLRAAPTARVTSDPGETRRSVLSRAERDNAGVLIVRRGDRYYWASRDDRELVPRRSGVYMLFIEPGGGGYVKVLDQRLVSEGMRFPGGPLQFFEHVSTGMTTITYWGEAAAFDP